MYNEIDELQKSVIALRNENDVATIGDVRGIVSSYLKN